MKSYVTSQLCMTYVFFQFYPYLPLERGLFLYMMINLLQMDENAHGPIKALEKILKFAICFHHYLGPCTLVLYLPRLHFKKCCFA